MARKDRRSAYKPILFNKALIIGEGNFTDYRLLSMSTIKLCLSALTGAEWSTRWDILDEEVLDIVRLAGKELLEPVTLPDMELAMSGLLEVGAIVAFPGLLDEEATGWILCDGRFIVRETYGTYHVAPELFDFLEATNVQFPGAYASYELQSDPPIWNIEIPDLAYVPGRTIVGASGLGGTYEVNHPGGAETVSLTAAQGGAHTHSHGIRVGSIAQSGAAGSDVFVISGADFEDTSSSGSGQAHNNMPPYVPLFYHILSRAIEVPVNLDDRYVRDVFAVGCELWQTKEGDSLIKDLNECGNARTWDEVEEGNEPAAVVDDDCLWGAIAALVDFMIDRCEDFLDALETIGDAVDSVTDMLKNMGIQWVLPAVNVLEFIQFAGGVVISLARIDLADTELTDGWKCDLFCAVKANGNLLDLGLWDAWLDTVEDLDIPYAPGGLVMRLLEKYILGANYLFKRYILFANNDICNDDWMTLCECGSVPTCDTVDVSWGSIGATPATWIGQKAVPPDEWSSWIRADNTYWRTTQDWQHGLLTYTPSTPCIMNKFTVWANRETPNQMSVDIKFFNAGGDEIAHGHWYYRWENTPPNSFELVNTTASTVHHIRVEVYSRRMRVTRCKLEV